MTLNSTTRNFLRAFTDIQSTYMEGFEHNDKKRTSCLTKAYRTARLLSGRDMRTGALDEQSMGLVPALWTDEDSPYFLGKNSFVGVLNYLIILEMIGSILKKKNTSQPRGNGIVKALKVFSNCPELVTSERKNRTRKIRAISQLRNGLAYNYGLAVPASGRATNESFKFALSYTMGAQDPIVILPANKWRKGDFSDKFDSSNTTINCQRIGTLVEDVLTNIIALLEEDSLKLRISMAKLKSMYTLL